MPLTQVRSKGLWTPDGNVLLDQKDMIQLTRRELTMLALLHEFAAKHQITVVCKRCDTAIRGLNSGQETSPGVECQCRQFLYSGG